MVIVPPLIVKLPSPFIPLEPLADTVAVIDPPLKKSVFANVYTFCTEHCTRYCGCYVPVGLCVRGITFDAFARYRINGDGQISSVNQHVAGTVGINTVSIRIINCNSTAIHLEVFTCNAYRHPVLIRYWLFRMTFRLTIFSTLECVFVFPCQVKSSSTAYLCVSFLSRNKHRYYRWICHLSDCLSFRQQCLRWSFATFHSYCRTVRIYQCNAVKSQFRFVISTDVKRSICRCPTNDIFYFVRRSLFRWLQMKGYMSGLLRSTPPDAPVASTIVAEVPLYVIKLSSMVW